MGLEIENINFELLSSEQSLRFDYGFVNYKNNQSEISEFYTFCDLFDFVKKEEIDLSLYSEINYVEIGDISKQGDITPVQLDLVNKDELLESYYKKIDKGDIISVNKGDILISSIRPNLKKIALIQEKSESYFYTKALIHLRPKIDSIIAYYLLRTVSFDFINCVSRIGKGYPTLKLEDLKTITFNKLEIDSILKNLNTNYIYELINNINNLQQNQELEIDIINEELVKEFNFDLKEFNKLKNKSIFNSSFSNFADNIDLRYSVKFQHPAHKYLVDFLFSKTNKRLKDLVKEPIVLGKTISPKEFDEDTDCYYISMATIKSYSVDLEEAKTVSVKYESENESGKLKKGDIIVSRSGVAIGKFALLEENINAIHADFTMRIRLDNKKIMNEFAYYIFRSVFTQEFIGFNKKGLQNKNIFPSQIGELPILDYSLNDQAKIVERIKTRILDQQKYTREIEAKKTEIEKLILESLEK